MSWIKRNLGFVISGAVGLALLGVAFWYLTTKMQADQAATEAFDSQLAALRGVQGADPFPSDQNIEAVKKEAAKAAQLAEEAKAMFPPFQKFANLTDQQFKRYIEVSLDEMHSNAKRYGVELPPEFYFTFGSLRKVMEFDPKLVPQWVQQMEEIKNLVRIMIEARVNMIVQVRRIPISEEESVNYPNDFMSGLEIVTNQSVIRVPFEITFQSFSGELAAVLEGFMRSTNCVLIKNLQVDPSGVQAMPFVAPTAEAPVVNSTAAEAVQNPEQPAAPRKSAEQRFFERYGIRRPPSSVPAPKPVPPPVAIIPRTPPATKPVTVLTEEPLRVVIFLEVIKIEPKPEPVAAPKGAGRVTRAPKPTGESN